MRLVVVFLDFSCFADISTVLGVLDPVFTFVLLTPQNGLFHTPSTLRFKWKECNFDAIHTMKSAERRQKTNGSIFTHVQGGSHLPWQVHPLAVVRYHVLS